MSHKFKKAEQQHEGSTHPYTHSAQTLQEKEIYFTFGKFCRFLYSSTGLGTSEVGMRLEHGPNEP